MSTEESPSPAPEMPYTPTHVIIVSWDADTGYPRLIIGKDINIFEARSLLEAALEDLWEHRPDVKVVWEGMDEDDDDEDDDDEE